MSSNAAVHPPPAAKRAVLCHLVRACDAHTVALPERPFSNLNVVDAAAAPPKGVDSGSDHFDHAHVVVHACFCCHQVYIRWQHILVRCCCGSIHVSPHTGHMLAPRSGGRATGAVCDLSSFMKHPW